VQANTKHEEDMKHLKESKEKEQRDFWRTFPRSCFQDRPLNACMLELPEPVRARLGLSADGGPGCEEGSASNTGTGTNGTGTANGENVGTSAEGSGAGVITSGGTHTENGDGRGGANDSENPPPPPSSTAGPNCSVGAEELNGATRGAGSSSGTGAVARSGGSGISAATAAAEKVQREIIRDGMIRMKEVTRGVAHFHGVKAVMHAVGTREVQARWADPRRLHACDPYDFGNDVLAWAAKAVGGNVSARRAAAEGLEELVGQRIDVFLPMFVQWVGATVEAVVDSDPGVALVTFWCAFLPCWRHLEVFLHLWGPLYWLLTLHYQKCCSSQGVIMHICTVHYFCILLVMRMLCQKLFQSCYDEKLLFFMLHADVAVIGAVQEWWTRAHPLAALPCHLETQQKAATAASWHEPGTTCIVILECSTRTVQQMEES
jgi:hypothetical protein